MPLALATEYQMVIEKMRMDSVMGYLGASSLCSSSLIVELLQPWQKYILCWALLVEVLCGDGAQEAEELHCVNLESGIR